MLSALRCYCYYYFNNASSSYFLFSEKSFFEPKPARVFSTNSYVVFDDEALSSKGVARLLTWDFFSESSIFLTDNGVIILCGFI